jgi:hypothetical protein
VAVYPLLAVLWALVLVPPLVRGRVRNRAELAEFDRIRLCFVGSTAVPSQNRDGAPPPPIRRTATQRRRRVLAVIGAGMVISLVAAVILGTRVAWGMHLAFYDVLIAYVGLLARSRDRQAGRQQVLVPVAHASVRELPRPMAPPTPLRRPARGPALPALLHAASR